MEEKKAIVIWGCNEFSAKLVELLKDSACVVQGFIDKNISQSFCSIPVYTPNEFKATAQFATTPIVIASIHGFNRGIPIIDFEGIYQFKKLLQEITHEYQIKNHLLHASALFDLLHLEYPNKIIPFGLPGSGIVLFSHICAAIVAKHNKSFVTKNKTALFFERLCFEYSHLIQQVMPDLLHCHQGFGFHMSSWKVGTSYAICPVNNDRITIFSYPTRNHVIGPVCNYHYIPSKETLNKLHAGKFKLFFNNRNPLDVILSCINKNNGLDKEKRFIDMKNFCSTSNFIIKQLNEWYPLSSHFQTFSYDSLNQDPIIAIKVLMKQLGVWPSRFVAKKIWDKLAFKPLTAAPKDHFWSGGINKWERYFNETHLSFLKEAGIEAVLEKYNYFSTLERFKQRTASLSKDQWKMACSASEVDDFTMGLSILHRKESDETLSFLQNHHGHDNCKMTENLIVAGGDTTLVERIQYFLDNSYINQLVLSGSYPGFKIL